MISFHEYSQSRQFDKKLIDQFGQYKVFTVNGKTVRDSSKAAEEFGGSGTHSFYPQVVPENEIWIEDDVEPKERDILIAASLYELKLIKRGMSSKNAYDASLARQKDYRESSRLSRKKPSQTNRQAHKAVYIKRYGHIENENIEVWLVDGEKVRNLYKVDAIEGMHGFAYSWVPNDEIWIEKGPHTNKEAPFILLHEFVERILMKYNKTKYDSAHKIASKVEFSKRPDNFSKEQALALTKEKALEMAKKFS